MIKKIKLECKYFGLGLAILFTYFRLLFLTAVVGGILSVIPHEALDGFKGWWLEDNVTQGSMGFVSLALTAWMLFEYLSTTGVKLRYREDEVSRALDYLDQSLREIRSNSYKIRPSAYREGSSVTVGDIQDDLIELTNVRRHLRIKGFDIDGEP